MSFVDLNVGTGGLGREVASQYKTWTNNYDRSPLLVDIRTSDSKEKNMLKQAPIEYYEASSLVLPRRFDCVFAKEFFLFLRDKTAFLQTITKHIKPNGHLLFTDYVLETND